MRKFLSTINYSSVNEDSFSEIKALELSSQDKVVCITGSGSRPLDLLSQSFSEIISVDINPHQNFLLEFKIAGIRNLSYEEFTELIGLAESEQRLKLYKEIEPLLSEPAKIFWNKNTHMIRNGVLFQGKWEKYFSLLAASLKLIKNRPLKNIFDCLSVKEQKIIWNTSFKSFVWQKFMRTISSKFFWKYLYGDPGFYKYVPEDFSVYSYLNKKFNEGASNILYNKSPFLTLLLTGYISTATALPPHLLKENFTTLKNGIDRIKIITASLGCYLSASEEKYDAFSLSDISSYTSEQQYDTLFQIITEKANKNSRICERQFLVKRNLPVNLAPCYIQNNELETELELTDNSIFYTFHCYKKR